MRIVMCCHKAAEAVPPLCVAVQGGAALNPKLDGMLHDDEGDNISLKNREYCELTAMYWAWKNMDADYIGLCHYRRFFGFGARTKRPYIAVGKLTEKRMRLLGTADEALETIRGCDAVIPRSEDMGISVREHYNTSPHHFPEDLRLFGELLKSRHPELAPAAEEYLSGRRQYFCNMFVMRRELFCRYCETLFPLLEEFDKSKTLHGYFQGDRTDGYLAERFTGIFITKLKQEGAVLREIPRIDAYCSLKKRALYRLLPPESGLRRAAKKVLSVKC